MIKTIKPEKIKEFLESFYNNPQEWYKKQIDEDFEFDEETQLKIIKEKFYVKPDNYAIEYIKNPTEEVCLKAVKRNGWTIGYIENPTEEMQLEAIKQNCFVIKDIENPSEEMCLEAVKQDGWALGEIKNPTEKVCLEAVKEDGWALGFIKNPTEEMRLEAIKQDGSSIHFIKKPDQSFEIVEAFFDHYKDSYWKNCKNYYKYLEKKFITKEQGLMIIQDDPENINLLSEEVQKEILEMKPELDKYIDRKDIKNNEKDLNNFNDFFK